MPDELPHNCDGMRRAIEDANSPVAYWSEFREFGIELRGQEAIDEIEYCPWCGNKLPSSLRDEYLNRLEELKLEPGDRNLPIQFRSDAWWRLRN
jgi:hypothetical protein